MHGPFVVYDANRAPATLSYTAPPAFVQVEFETRSAAEASQLTPPFVEARTAMVLVPPSSQLSSRASAMALPGHRQIGAGGQWGQGTVSQ